ncbi:MAG: hypothetical protein U1F48_05210 [Burkholderiales bacterium]
MRKLVLAALCACAASLAVAQTAYTLPDCPAPDDVVTVVGVPPSDKVYGPARSVEVTGSVIRLRTDWYWNTFSPPPSPVRATLGRLPEGAYRLEIYAREFRAPDAPGPEDLVASKSFVVQANPPSCAAETIVALDPLLHVAKIGEPYATAPTLRALDAHGHPVSGVTINLARFPAIGPTLADFTSRPQQVVTGANGEARLTGLTANGVPGAFQYMAWYSYAGETHAQYFVFANRGALDVLPLVPVVEYFNYGLLHFFMTSDAGEMRALDAGLASGWHRTGEAFLAFAPAAAGTVAGAVPVCRFYGRPEAGLDSHFFSASAAECADVAQRFGHSWMLETSNAFALFLPDTATGACPQASMPIYRGYNNLPDANHRYATSPEGAVHPPAYGIGSPAWSLEGYGPGVVMCAPR